MGRQLFRVAAALQEDPVLAELAASAAGGRSPGHHAVAFGATLGRDGATDESVASCFAGQTPVTALISMIKVVVLPPPRRPAVTKNAGR